MSVLLVCASSFLGMGCKTYQDVSSMSAKEAQAYRLGTSEAEADDSRPVGYLVGSFAFSGREPTSIMGMRPKHPPYSSYGFNFRSLFDVEPQIRGDVGVGRMLFAGYLEDMSIEVPDGKGYVFLIPLPSGLYEFYDFHFYSAGGYSSSTWSAREEFSILFTIRPGQATYVGQIQATSLFGKNIFGMVVPAGGYHEMSDQWQRDRSLLLEKYPFLTSVEAHVEPIANPLLSD
ncbi:MAG: hypothetical protein ACOCVG_03300 [Verrucomicrobiota bacterium]